MRFRVEVIVMPLPDVLDPQGQAIEAVLANAVGAGMLPVRAMRVGKLIRFELEAPGEAAARRFAGELAGKVLANPNIESWDLRLEPLT